MILICENPSVSSAVSHHYHQENRRLTKQPQGSEIPDIARSTKDQNVHRLSLVSW